MGTPASTPPALLEHACTEDEDHKTKKVAYASSNAHILREKVDGLEDRRHLYILTTYGVDGLRRRARDGRDVYKPGTETHPGCSSTACAAATRSTPSQCF